jgi:hypothetical protein
MPPTHVHFNGRVNLADSESVMREIVSRIPSGLRRVPDGETGDRVTGSSSRCRSSCSCPGWFRRTLVAAWFTDEVDGSCRAGPCNHG